MRDAFFQYGIFVFVFTGGIGGLLYIVAPGEKLLAVFCQPVLLCMGEPIFVIAMLFSIVFNYFVALRIEELKTGSGARKLMLAVAILVNLGILFVFKYMNFVTTVSGWSGVLCQ